MLSLAPSTFTGLERVWQEFPGILEIFLEDTNFEIFIIYGLSSVHVSMRGPFLLHSTQSISLP